MRTIVITVLALALAGSAHARTVKANNLTLSGLQLRATSLVSHL